MSTGAEQRLSVEEYFALEETSEVKHEYFDGEIFAMAGAKAAHNLLTLNFGAELRNALKEQGCRVFSSDMRVSTPSGLWTYPDVSVVCDEPQYEDERQITLLNPQVIVEVLSESTEGYDRGKKFDNYQSIESLEEYLLVSQERAHVDQFIRQADGNWLIKKYGGLAAAVESRSLDYSIFLEEIYRGVDVGKAS